MRLGGGRGWLGRWAFLLCLWLPVWGHATGLTGLQLDRAADGLYLSAKAPVGLPAALEDALERGVPVHFVWQAELKRTRWYWADQRLATAARTVRVAYQPLTRRWRVSFGSGVPGDTGVAQALHQNLDTLEEALATASRVTRWRVASAADLDEGADRLEIQFRLDAGLLPRPFQIGNAAGADSPTSFRQVLAVPPERSPVQEPPSVLNE